jgi:DNA-binding IclR family transcriptional regulator
LTCTATGKALLAFQLPGFIAVLLKKKLKPYTRSTVTDPAELEKELRRIRKRGFAVNKGEWREDIGGIAAPVFGRTGHAVGALGVTMPLERFPREIASPASSVVLGAAQRLSLELGYLPQGATTLAMSA